MAEVSATPLQAATADIQDLAVTTAKIGTASITTAKIADANITTAKIADANITTAKIANLAVTSALIDTAAITNAKIGNLAVDTLQLSDSAVTSLKRQLTNTYSEAFTNLPANSYTFVTISHNLGRYVVGTPFSGNLNIAPYGYDRTTNQTRIGLYNLSAGTLSGTIYIDYW